MHLDTFFFTDSRDKIIASWGISEFWNPAIAGKVQPRITCCLTHKAVVWNYSRPMTLWEEWGRWSPTQSLDQTPHPDPSELSVGPALAIVQMIHLSPVWYGDWTEYLACQIKTSTIRDPSVSSCTCERSLRCGRLTSTAEPKVHGRSPLHQYKQTLKHSIRRRTVCRCPCGSLKLISIL